MADFCKQCAISSGMPRTDLAGLLSDEEKDEGFQYVMVLCEGCGNTIVDDDGVCQGGCDEKH